MYASMVRIKSSKTIKTIATQVYKACRETLSNKTAVQPQIGIFAESASSVAFQKYSVVEEQVIRNDLSSSFAVLKKPEYLLKTI